MSENESSNYDSDVSLDEEDEELIWRVFFEAFERSKDKQNESGNSDNEEDSDSNSDNISITSEDLVAAEDEELVKEYKKMKEMKFDKNLDEERKQQLLILNLPNDQMERYEAFRRLRINRPGIKKLCNGVLGHSVHQSIISSICGMAKMFVGDIITRGFEVQEREAKAKLTEDIEEKKHQKREILKSLDSGIEVEVDDTRLHYTGDDVQQLQPHQIREAWRLFKLENSVDYNCLWRSQGDANGQMFR
ncbi:transcription initiation factor TFIID subunit 11 [Scheffersomyces spartinae]|uniref:Transcription initiation factor TFIID subunit 11 n=1 Tax=Scheffersomyces spartinae TaxID=45513 RepID=A0A9P7V7S7_9ASCO|nr:transcription initiation factor TFIID subunit 11 [Scheffersomyces spartinae]KAG7192954.1 transcription initiation factor TFIID subunit 11 [Scheffersomyces spartinae]